jgi:hypothetical protein
MRRRLRHKKKDAEADLGDQSWFLGLGRVLEECIVPHQLVVVPVGKEILRDLVRHWIGLLGITKPIGQEILRALDRARALALALAFAGIIKIVFQLSLADQSCKVLHVRSMS